MDQTFENKTETDFMDLGFSQMSASILADLSARSEGFLEEHLADTGFSKPTASVLAKNNIGVNTLANMTEFDVLKIPDVDYVTFIEIKKVLHMKGVVLKPCENQEDLEVLKHLTRYKNYIYQLVNSIKASS